ncbi:MAG: potassium channel family protein [Pseudomonadota bacterium]
MREFTRFMHHFFEMMHFTRAVLVVLLLALLCLAILIVLIEDKTVGEALYFTMITGMTVGYGDIVPTTPLGKIISVAVALIGVVFVGLVVAIATRALALAVEEERRRRGEPPRPGAPSP